MATTLKVKNGIIRLPKNVERQWNQADAVLFPSRDTLVVKRVQKPLGKLSDIPNRISLPRMKAREIEREITAYRRGIDFLYL